jgi:hypothetical protein
MASQLREDLQQQELALKRKLGNEAAARRAAEEELRTVRQELSQLQGMLGPGMFGTASSAAAGLGGLGLQQQQQAPGQQLGDSWRAAAAAGPPALAAPGFKWMLVREGEDPTAAAAEDELGSSLPGTPHSVLSGGVGFGGGSRNMQRAGSTASSGAVGAGGFDTSELLQQHTGHSFSSNQQQNQQHGVVSGAMSDAASAYGGAGGIIPVSPTSSASVQQLQQQQMRQVAARLGSGSVGEATLQRLRAALRQKTGECAALEGRLRELEATRDQLAGELVATTHTAEKVRV